MIRLNDHQRQADAGCHPDRTRDVLICDEDSICVDIDRGAIPLQPVGHSLMRLRASYTEKACLGEQEGANANTGDPRRSAGKTRDGLNLPDFQHE
jgi:hypothetical protein